MPTAIMLHVRQNNRTTFRQAVTWPDLPRFGDRLQIDDWLLVVASVRWILTSPTLRAQSVQVQVTVEREGERPLRELLIDGSEVLPS